MREIILFILDRGTFLAGFVNGVTDGGQRGESNPW